MWVDREEIADPTEWVHEQRDVGGQISVEAAFLDIVQPIPTEVENTRIALVLEKIVIDFLPGCLGENSSSIPFTIRSFSIRSFQAFLQYFRRLPHTPFRCFGTCKEN